MVLLLDTSVAIQLRDLDPRTSARLAQRADQLAVSLITIVELEGGIAAHPVYAADRQQSLDKLLARVTVLPFDQAVVDCYARIIRQTGFSRPRILDRLIAATAIVHDLSLVTVNGRDFRDIPGLELEVWPAAAQ